GAFHGFFTHKNSLFVQIAGKGIHKYKKGKLVSLRDKLVKGHEKILFSAYFNLKNTVVGTSDNKIYLFNGRGFVQFAKYTEIRDFLEENILWDGINLSGSYFAVTTLTGGCAVIDKMYGKNVFTINYQTGLPDDEIYTISKDNQGGVWLSHEHGISRFDLKIPFRSYSTYPGIDATINSVMFYNNQLYVAANDGVYKLKKIENYKEVEVLVKKKKQIPVKKTRKSYKKSSRKSKTKKVEDKSPKYEYVAQKQYAMQSIKHRFVPIENVHGKCKEVFEEDGRLFALSNYGLFEIRDTIGIPLVSDTYVSDVCKDRDSTILYIATLNGIYVMSYSYTEHGEVITEEYRPLFTNVTQPVHSLTQDSSRAIYFGMDGKAFMSKNDSLLVFQQPEELLFPRKVYEPVTVRLINDKVHFVQSFGVFVYDTYSNDLKYTDIDLITLDNIRFTTNKNSNWVFYNNEWKSVDGGRTISGQTYLNLFPKIKNIYTDKKDNIWLIDNSENLIKILAEHESNPDTTLSTIICSVSDNNDSLYTLENPVFSYANNVVKLNLTAPFYMSNEGIEYS
ncbi:MAG: hypothetical protein MI922_03275, partial [Bacteroidales bacterium]|nr:hypothetical protein [Bacteroidales bacterium]